MVLLVACRSWLTLALYAGLPFAVYLTTTGVNDYSPGFLILSAMLLSGRTPCLGAAVLAVAASIKPYAFAWFLPAIGFAGTERRGGADRGDNGPVEPGAHLGPRAASYDLCD